MGDLERLRVVGGRAGRESVKHECEDRDDTGGACERVVDVAGVDGAATRGVEAGSSNWGL